MAKHRHEQEAEGLEPFEPGTEAEAKKKAEENKPQESGFDPIATMVQAEKDRVEAEEKAQETAREEAKAAAEDDRKAVAYVISHAGVGGHSQGTYVQADQLIPVPRNASKEEADKARKEGIKRLTDLGAVTPIYEEK